MTEKTEKISESIVDVIIEISKGSKVKYEYDKAKNVLVCDRVLHTPFAYPFNYGFIPNTLSEDGDPIDAVVLMDDELIPGCQIRCKILGYLDTRDDAGNDPKLILCPIDKVDPTWKGIDDIFNKRINLPIIEKTKYFFEHYKDLENKSVHVGSFHNSVEALSIYKQSLIRFTNGLTQKTKYFFENYKDPENKSINIGSFHNSVEALNGYKQSLNKFTDGLTQKSKITGYFK